MDTCTHLSFVGACNGIPSARNTLESIDDQGQEFPKDCNVEAAATLAEYSQQLWADKHTAALQTSVTKVVLQKNTVEDQQRDHFYFHSFRL